MPLGWWMLPAAVSRFIFHLSDLSHLLGEQCKLLLASNLCTHLHYSYSVDVTAIAQDQSPLYHVLFLVRGMVVCVAFAAWAMASSCTQCTIKNLVWATMEHDVFSSGIHWASLTGALNFQ